MKLHTRQIKKDKDDGSNVSLSGDTKHGQGKKEKEEQMLVSADNQSAEKDALTNPMPDMVSRIDGHRLTHRKCDDKYFNELNKRLKNN